MILLVIALCSATPVFCSKEAYQNKGQSPFVNAGFGAPCEPNLAFSLSPADKENIGFGSRELVYKFVFSVLLVVILSITGIYLTRKFGSRITGFSGKKVQIIETVRLGPRKALHLLKIHNREILIASTSESITKIARFDQDLPTFPKEQGDNETE